MSQKNDLLLWRKTADICRECLDLDRAMLAKLGRLDLDRGRDAENYVDPALWEHFIAARQDLVDFTTSSIGVLTTNVSYQKPVDGNKRSEEDDKNFVEQSELENRLMTSLKEMLDLENKLANYLNENLSVLRETIDGLSKNQVLFSAYAKKYNKPDPGYLNSDI
ncbi:MAG: hypothetical protein LBS44_01495 [Deltaproteobacteria bacterium]|jgi:hypothetical protein|nr:hypothetical protein [Deltaproteobacteria bacterium]